MMDSRYTTMLLPLNGNMRDLASGYDWKMDTGASLPSFASGANCPILGNKVAMDLDGTKSIMGPRMWTPIAELGMPDLSSSGVYVNNLINALNDATDTAWHTNSSIPGAYVRMSFPNPIEIALLCIQTSGATNSIYNFCYSDDGYNFVPIRTIGPLNSGWHNNFFEMPVGLGRHKHYRFELTNTPGDGGWISEIKIKQPHEMAFDVLDHDFTLDWWEYRRGGGTVFLTENNVSFPGMLFGYGGDSLYMTSDRSSWSIVNRCSMGGYTSNTWTHRAVCRRGAHFEIYKQGRKVNYWDSSYKLAPVWSGPPAIGRSGTDSNIFNGLLSNVRLTNGLCRWTSDFNPSLISYEDSVLQHPVIYTPRSIGAPMGRWS